MSHYKPYPVYKDSGVEWLGQVPQHWQVKRLKFIATVQTGVAKGKDNNGKDTLEVPYLRVANVQDGYLSLDDVSTIEIPRADLSRYSLCPGDVLMNEGGDFDKLGRGHVWQGEIEPCIHQNHVFAVRPAKVPPYWLNAFTGSQAAQFYFMGRSKQSTNLASISSSSVMELPVVVPPDDELSAVLTHLDRETTRIDALVKKKTRFIELLREKRQALITHAVTKGLDRNMKMKDSGVEWLGEVPAHWELVPLKYITPSLTVGIVVNPSDYVADEGLPFIYGGDITEGRIHFESSRRISSANSVKNSKTRLVAGDLVTVRVGAPGITAVVPLDCEGGNCASVMHIRRGRFDSDWLCYAMNSRVVRYQVEVVQYGAAQEQFNISHAVDFLIPVPPFEEQAAIASSLNQEGLRIDTLISKTELSLSLLKERRSALITSAVTGQIDLREAV
jgi:type I restriction enzyme S subunit